MFIYVKYSTFQAACQAPVEFSFGLLILSLRNGQGPIVSGGSPRVSSDQPDHHLQAHKEERNPAHEAGQKVSFQEVRH